MEYKSSTPQNKSLINSLILKKKLKKVTINTNSFNVFVFNLFCCHFLSQRSYHSTEHLKIYLCIPLLNYYTCFKGSTIRLQMLRKTKRNHWYIAVLCSEYIHRYWNSWWNFASILYCGSKLLFLSQNQCKKSKFNFNENLKCLLIRSLYMWIIREMPCFVFRMNIYWN